MPAPSTRDQRLAADMAALDRLPVPVPGPRKLPPPCESCQRFTPDEINPDGGMGTCRAGHTTPYPGQRRNCGDFAASH